MGFLHSSVHPQPNVLALSLFIDTPEKGGMRSLRRDMSAAWMYPGSMLLITPQSFQELAIDRFPFSFFLFGPFSSSTVSLNNAAHYADQHPDCDWLGAYCCKWITLKGVSHLPQTAYVCDKKRLLPNSKAVAVR